MKTSVYFNLDGTPTTINGGFDLITKDVLRKLNVEDDNIKPSIYSTAFFHAFKDFQPSPRVKAFKQYKEQIGVDIDPKHAAELYRQTELERTQPLNHLQESLEQIAGKAIIGVITAGTTKLQRAKLHKLGIEDVLDDIRITYEEQQSKQGIFQTIRESRDTTPVYVSTSTSDIEEAQEVGWKVYQDTIRAYLDRP